MTPRELIIRWRSDAETLARYNDDRVAVVLKRAADELEAALRSADDDLLDLASAARESGYSTDRLRHLISAGEIPNAGKRGAPRVRRGDLPSKVRRASGAFDADAAARLVLSNAS